MSIDYEGKPTQLLTLVILCPSCERSKQHVLLAAPAQVHHTLALCPACPSGSPAPAAPPASQPAARAAPCGKRGSKSRLACGGDSHLAV